MIRIERFKSQRDSLCTKITAEERSRNIVTKLLEKKEEQYKDLQDKEKAKEDLLKGDAWKLVTGECVCNESLLEGVGKEDYGVVSYTCGCTKRRMMHFKCILSIPDIRCPWCRDK